jgi:hypothetical protein
VLRLVRTGIISPDRLVTRIQTYLYGWVPDRRLGMSDIQSSLWDGIFVQAMTSKLWVRQQCAEFAECNLGRRVATPYYDLLAVLRAARALLAQPDNNFDWSSWKDGVQAIRELDNLIATLESGRLPGRLTLQVLFAPTGPIQEVSLSSGWSSEFLALASRFDAAEEAAYNRAWWRRLLNWRIH